MNITNEILKYIPIKIPSGGTCMLIDIKLLAQLEDPIKYSVRNDFVLALIDKIVELQQHISDTNHHIK